MARRLLQIFVPSGMAAPAMTTLGELGADSMWREPDLEDADVIAGVVDAKHTAEIMDALWHAYSQHKCFRVLVIPLAAAIPRARPAEKSLDVEPRGSGSGAISREELYATIQGEATLSRNYAVMVILSTLVAAIGLSSNNVAAVIGAMVVAPLLGPNMGLALSLTLAERDLFIASTKSVVVGFSIAMLAAIALGFVLPADPTIPEIHSRTLISVADIILALAAGCAGTLAYTSGAPSSLIGVMVAVALLPPTVAAGLLTSHGFWSPAARALILVGANVAALNLAAMVTFHIKGMRPRNWWNVERAKKSRYVGMGIWLALIVVLAAAVYLFPQA